MELDRFRIARTDEGQAGMTGGHDDGWYVQFRFVHHGEGSLNIENHRTMNTMQMACSKQHRRTLDTPNETIHTSSKMCRITVCLGRLLTLRVV